MAVIHNESQSRFELEIEGSTAVLDYDLDGERIAFTHTEVPEQFEGARVWRTARARRPRLCP